MTQFELMQQTNKKYMIICFEKQGGNRVYSIESRHYTKKAAEKALLKLDGRGYGVMTAHQYDDLDADTVKHSKYF
jgi:hypothetical protein